MVGKVLQKTVLDPWKAVPFLLLAHYTTKGSELAQQHPKAVKVLKVLTFLSVLRRLNAWLNRRAINNGVSDHYDWNREVVVLTGGSSGIGNIVAQLLGKRGIKVAILDIQPPQGTLPPTVRFYECDITSAAAIGSVAATIRTTLGEPTVLINNAGLLTGKTILGTTEAITHKMFEVNTLAHYWLAQEFLPAMIKRNHGMVVTLASQAGYVTTPNMVDYAATKAGAVAFHEGLASELATRYKAPRVRTVLVTPGFTRTTLINVLTPEDSFIGPLLYPETVAEGIVSRVISGESGHFNVPGTSGAVARYLRALPVWFQTGMRNRLERSVRGPD